MSEERQPHSFYEFGPFVMDERRRRLLRGGDTVPLTKKEFQTLLVLVRGSGRIVEKDELMAAVWRNTHVEEGNLAVHVSKLRGKLGRREDGAPYIETETGHGYRFTACVHEVEDFDLVVRKRTLSRSVIEEELIPDELAEDESAIAVQPVVVKNVSLASRRPAVSIAAIGVSLVLGVAAVVYLRDWKSSATSSAASNIRSIAILPMKSVAQAIDDRALSLGLADALLTSLGRVPGVRVLSAGASNRYADLQKEPADIGKELGVDSVLEGTLQRANGKLRVTLRLVRTSDGVQIWSNSFDESETDIFKLQDAMAAQTAQSLRWRLTEEQQRQIAKRHTENGDAYQAYLRGRLFFDKRNQEGYDKAIAEFQWAIELDPKYALAYSGLADVYALEANTTSGSKRDALYEKARTTAMKALELDEALAEAHTSLGWVRRVHDWDWNGAEREFKRAIELNPNYANARQWYSFLLITLGRADEALDEMQAARQIDPLSRRILVNYLALRTFRREYNETLPIVQQIVNLEEDKADDMRLLSIDFLMRGDYAKVIEIGNEVSAKDGGKRISEYMTANLAVAYARTGQEAKSKELLAYLESRAKTNSEAAFRLAMALSDLGHREEAIRLLEGCLQAHEDRMVWIKVEPRFDPLRNDERFRTLLRTMNLPA
ncbi:MAG TPA: winged helix-turn-helix domain-containing protein [Pyrinomonadaceae bacterium]|jgi:TolB-like protein/DNA-binding winged helix-turn-helix (wHTH) protein